jgi:hypothetical protein
VVLLERFVLPRPIALIRKRVCRCRMRFRRGSAPGEAAPDHGQPWCWARRLTARQRTARARRRGEYGLGGPGEAKVLARVSAAGAGWRRRSGSDGIVSGAYEYARNAGPTFIWHFFF